MNTVALDDLVVGALQRVTTDAEMWGEYDDKQREQSIILPERIIYWHKIVADKILRPDLPSGKLEIGKIILSEMVADARENNADCVRIDHPEDSEFLRSYYTSAGFVKKGTKEFIRADGSIYTATLAQLDL